MYRRFPPRQASQHSWKHAAGLCAAGLCLECSQFLTFFKASWFESRMSAVRRTLRFSAVLQQQTLCVGGFRKCFYPAHLSQLGEHDHDGGVVLPQHPPEVLGGLSQGSLRGQVRLLLSAPRNGGIKVKVQETKAKDCALTTRGACFIASLQKHSWKNPNMTDRFPEVLF